MKKIRYKQNKIVIFFNLLVILFFCLQFCSYYFFENGGRNISIHKQKYNICKEYVNGNEDEKILIKKKYDEDNFDDCDEIVFFDNSSPSAISIYSNILTGNNISTLIFPYFIPIIILFPFVYKLSKEFKDRQIKNYILRNTYKNYVKKIFSVAYSNLYLIPSIIAIIFIVSYILSGHLDPRSDIYFHFITISKELVLNPAFYLFYMIIIVLNFGFYTNIGLFVLSKKKNFVIALIESFLLIYFIWIINELFICNLLGNLFNVNALNFSLLNIYTWNSITRIDIIFMFNLCVYIITLVLAIMSYKDKEKFIQNCEK